MAASIDNRNYYDVLHVVRGAPTEIIRSSYRTLMQKLKCHPDLGGDVATAAIINEAYAVLRILSGVPRTMRSSIFSRRSQKVTPNGPRSKNPLWSLFWFWTRFASVFSASRRTAMAGSLRRTRAAAPAIVLCRLQKARGRARQTNVLSRESIRVRS